MTQMNLVERTDGLATVIHHRAQRTQERLPCLPIRQRGIGFPYLTGARRLNPRRLEPRPQLVADVQHRPRRDHWQHQLSSGCREDPQYPAQIGAEATAADENQSLAVVAMLIGELHGHTATE